MTARRMPAPGDSETHLRGSALFHVEVSEASVPCTGAGQNGLLSPQAISPPPWGACPVPAGAGPSEMTTCSCCRPPGAAALSPGLGWSLLLLPASRRSTRVISTPQAPDLLLISCPV